MGRKISVCPLCGEQFTKTRSDKVYCSKACTYVACSRASRAKKRKEINELGTDCPHNEGLVCYKRTCGSCGWNPVVEAKRREKLGLKPAEGLV